jgi:hypothetical protein
MGMQSAEFAGRCRSYAAKCVKISRHISDPAGKLVLLEMAQSWLKLAETTSQGDVPGTQEGDQGASATSET